ncbi:uncharacterized protein LOC128559826 [Mercenaria mercenaria]|uniref:uncharacterized protein LOC128559826 n=1 Tax=Mercenaria mercenaria TaxID=6596 RepID=UPI00234EC3B1|nr:uncharacterized protein LOC128559826 [Mercenaria mercenaria]
MVPGVLKERDTVNITCVVKNGRPAPKVHIKVSGTEVPSAVQKDYVNYSTSLNTNVVTMTTFERSWNRENITCCRYNEWYKVRRACSQPKQVNFLYPPSDITLEVKIDEGLQMYALCSVLDSNPACVANFSAQNGIIASERYNESVRQPLGAWNSKYAVNLNVRKDDNGKKIECSADCPNFTVVLKSTVSITVPQKAEQRFNNQDTTGFGGNSFIWIIISSCLTVVLTGVFIACLVAIKKMKTAKAKWGANQVRHSASGGGTRFVY